MRLLEFDIWEFDRRGMHEQPFAGIFKFVDGGQAQYISDDEILLESFGPSRLFSRYHEIYAGSEIYRMRRGNEVVPTPDVFDGIEHAQMPSMDRAGSLCLLGQTPRYGLTAIRISADGRRQAWQAVPLPSEPWFEAKELVCDASGRYIASIYRDHPVRFGGGTGGLAMLDIAADSWSTVPLPHCGTQKKSRSKSRTNGAASGLSALTQRKPKWHPKMAASELKIRGGILPVGYLYMVGGADRIGLPGSAGRRRVCPNLLGNVLFNASVPQAGPRSRARWI